MTIAERFWPKVDTSAGLFGCWEWIAAKDHGYGKFRIARSAVWAHRVAYELRVGPILPNLELDHLCRNRGCVNPAHLDPVTTRENVLRSEGWAAVNARKTHCTHGHPYDATNTYVSRGSRYCRSCKRTSSNAAHARRPCMTHDWTRPVL